jgi:exonuclease SbcC
VILIAVEIENYKQFAGKHLIAPTPQGIVGVVGPNGVGKTTLFEAIEWCLYNPTTIRNEDVPPRAGVGGTCVRVTLEDPRDGLRYVVERRLKSKTATAEVYREDQPETRIVQGSRQVADYVARRLIGLSHRAFVSTFFTRQKELSFFGSLKETERRREVARLLGLETIRAAQQAIGQERADAAAEAKTLRAQFADQTEGRDFAAETGAAEAEVVAGHERVAQTDEKVAAAIEATRAARAELDRWQALKDEDQALAVEQEKVFGDERTADSRRASAADELALLDRAAGDRDVLAPVAAEEPVRAAAVLAHETERDRHLNQQRLVADRRRAGEVARKATNEIEKEVRRIPLGPGVPDDWTWRAGDADEPLRAAERLIALAEGLDVDSACERETELALCFRIARERDEAVQKAETYRAHLGRLERQLDEILAAGDPSATAEEATQARGQALAAAEGAAARAKVAAEERARLERIVSALHAADFSRGCPTCARPFSPEDLGKTTEVLNERVAELGGEEGACAKQRDAAAARARELEAVRVAAVARTSEADTLRGRIRDGAQKVADADAAAASRDEECAAALRRAGLTVDPTVEEVEQARIVADRLQRLARALPPLRILRANIADALVERSTAEQALAELGPVAYDAAAHESADRALDEARAAIVRIEELARQLARRPEVEADLAAAGADLKRLALERERLEQERAAVGFDPAGLERAAAVEHEAREAETAVHDERQAAAMALADAESRQRALAREHERIAGLADRADVRGRQADELDRMYREMNRFDQYVADRVTPQLAEHTGELLAAVTEGKYDRVAFDENYGLELFDGEERFPIASFSGGERDVAALCARLALSRLVGGQAGHPPEFLVLDEVFGSLDRERRSHVLEMLGTLAGSTDVFRQLFIISHVDDVRASSIFNQVWRLSESEEGVSQFEDITDAVGLDEV